MWLLSVNEVSDTGVVYRMWGKGSEMDECQRGE